MQHLSNYIEKSLHYWLADFFLCSGKKKDNYNLYLKDISRDMYLSPLLFLYYVLTRQLRFVFFALALFGLAMLVCTCIATAEDKQKGAKDDRQ